MKVEALIGILVVSLAWSASAEEKFQKLKGAQIRNPYDIGMFVQGPFAFRDLMTTYRNRAAPLDDAGALLQAA